MLLILILWLIGGHESKRAITERFVIIPWKHCHNTLMQGFSRIPIKEVMVKYLPHNIRKGGEAEDFKGTLGDLTQDNRIQYTVFPQK